MSETKTSTKHSENNPALSSIDDKFSSVLKKHQFACPSFEIYGSPTGFQTYGVLGTQIKRRIIDEWRKIFINSHDELTIYEIDTPIIGPEQVFIASGHVEKFTDPVVKDKNNKIERVDHYLKDRIRKSPLDIHAQEKLINSLDNCDNDALEELLKIYGEPNRNFCKIYEVNLMLDTRTTLSNSTSYLRPETAQGLITEFKNLYKFHGETLPFGIAQVGRVYRKEVNTKPFERLKEFEQAEIELFFDPSIQVNILSEKILNTSLNVFSASDQKSENPHYSNKTIREIIHLHKLNLYIVYFMYKIDLFCNRLGIIQNRLRFRQHLDNELAHYSSDCWDLEYLVRDKSENLNEVHPDENHWLEVVGIANRGNFDLTQHNSNDSMYAKRVFEHPVKKIGYDVKIDMKMLEKKFRKNTQQIKQYILNLEEINSKINSDKLEEIMNNNNESKETSIVIENVTFILEPNSVKVSRSEKLVSSEKFIPHIIEPSIGIDRMFYSLLNSLFWIRPNEPDRCVLSLNEGIAPITLIILPLFVKEVMTKYVVRIKNHIHRVRPEFSIKVDCSGASIGKRYARSDEIGIPYAVTIDYQTDSDDTVTVRLRDGMSQYRVKINDLFLLQ